MFGFCFGMHYFMSSLVLAIILTIKRELVALIVFLMSWANDVLWLVLAVPWIGLQCVIVVFLSTLNRSTTTEPHP